MSDLIDKLLPTRHRRLITGLFFGLLLLLGLRLHRDYGVSADERVDRLNGMVNVKYIAELVAPELVRNQADSHLIPALKNHIENDHGVAFEIPMALLSFVVARGDAQRAYYLRHLCIFLIFVAGVYALFKLSSFYLKSWRWGLLTALLLVLSPRLFADGFYNAKDIVFMALFTGGTYSLLRFLRRPSYRWALLHALVTALAVDIRILGMLLAAFTVGMVGLELLLPTQKRTTNRALLRGALLYVVLLPVFILIGWPALWEAPIANLIYSFRNLSKYPFRGSLLYWGNIIQVPADPLPWYYIPGWILVTTPLAYTLAALGGFLLTLRSFLQPWRTYLQAPEQRQNLLLLLWLLVPPLLVIGLNSVLYNAWRHLFFIYPALLILAARGMQHLYQRARRPTPARAAWVAVLLLAAAGLEAAYTAVRMVRLHPHQYVYFSFLPPGAAERLFELDYWGLSYREGLEWVLTHDPSADITISGNPSYLDNNLLILPPSQRARLRYVPSRAETPTKARYFLTAYHYYGGRPKTYPDSLGREVYTIRADGLRIFSVFKRW